MSKKSRITKPVSETACVGNEPEFIRLQQLFARAGIKRGLAYRRINDGTFRSVVLREPRNKQGIRLVHWPSVKSYLLRLMAEQAEADGGKGKSN